MFKHRHGACAYAIQNDMTMCKEHDHAQATLEQNSRVMSRAQYFWNTLEGSSGRNPGASSTTSHPLNRNRIVSYRWQVTNWRDRRKPTWTICARTSDSDAQVGTQPHLWAAGPLGSAQRIFHAAPLEQALRTKPRKKHYAIIP